MSPSRYLLASSSVELGSWLLAATRRCIRLKEQFRSHHFYGTHRSRGFGQDTSDLKSAYENFRFSLKYLNDYINVVNAEFKKMPLRAEFLQALHDRNADAENTVIELMNSLDALVRANLFLRKNEALFKGKSTKVIERTFKNMPVLFKRTSGVLRNILQKYSLKFNGPALRSDFPRWVSQAFNHLELPEQFESIKKMMSRFEDVLRSEFKHRKIRH